MMTLRLLLLGYLSSRKPGAKDQGRVGIVSRGRGSVEAEVSGVDGCGEGS